MSAILKRIDNRFRTIKEEISDTSWKDPNNPDYDRQIAENALYHTIGPLTDSPKWAKQWTSPGTPVPGFIPGGQAPKWTQEEVVFAYAGDPELLFASSGNPRSPRYGNRGGSPLYRMARKVSRTYARENNRAFFEDMYSNGFVALLRLMQPGQDMSMSAFISYVGPTVLGAMTNGIGGETRTAAAAGYTASIGGKDSKIAVRGLKSLLDEVNPREIRNAADVVRGKFQTTQSHEKTPDNPFGYFSAPYYQVLHKYADALESQDEEAIGIARRDIESLIDKIDDYGTMIGGASTGAGQAISTADRKTSIGISSMDAPAGSDETGSIAGNIEGSTTEEGFVDAETVNYILDIGLNHDLGKTLASSEKYTAMAVELGSKNGKIGGKFSAVEYRYILRTLGPYARSYPGKGVLRTNTKVPRDGLGWWQPGEDPEIESLPGDADGGSDGLWHSIWSRTGYEAMGPTAIAEEMTQEVEEFNRYGIPTARKISNKVKAGKADKAEAVSKMSVAQALRSATVKLKIIADIYASSLGIKESVVKGNALLEEVNTLDTIDRQIISEMAREIVRRINRSIVFEKAPPGWKGSVKAMKKYKDIDNPFALAWSMHKKGNKPHYKNDDSGKKKIQHKEEVTENVTMKPVDTIY